METRNTGVANTQETTLFDLTRDNLKNNIAPALSTGSLINLSLTNKYSYLIFKPTLFQRLQKYVERGSLNQVKALLNIHPDFASMTCNEKEFNYSGIKHLRQPTLLQLARALGDIDMCTAIAYGNKALLKQIKISPPTLFSEDNIYDFSVLISILEHGNKIAIENALVTFRNELDKIVSEDGFPFQVFLNAYEIYDKKYDLWNVEQCKLFSINVLGYLQRLAPPWARQVLADGIFDIVNKGKKENRGFILKNGDSIDPSHDIPHLGLGFDYVLNIYGWRCIDGFLSANCLYSSWSIGGLMWNKSVSLVDLMRPVLQPKPRSCVIL